MENLKLELSSKAVGGIDPNHPDMGPIMDSLIMTSIYQLLSNLIQNKPSCLDDRPYIDCATITPMTGNGLVKFEKFNVMNKLPWDDVNDQFIIQVSM